MKAEVENYPNGDVGRRLKVEDKGGHKYLILVLPDSEDIPQVNLDQLIYDIAEDIRKI